MFQQSFLATFHIMDITAILFSNFFLIQILLSFPVLPTTVPYLEEYGSNWAIFNMRFREATQAMYHWGHFDGTNARPVLKDAAHPTNMESEAIKGWEHEDIMARCLLSQRLPDMTVLCLDDYSTAKAR